MQVLGPMDHRMEHTVHRGMADGHVEVVDAFVYLGCMIDSCGGSRGEVLHRIGLARRGGSGSQASGWKQSYASIRHIFCQF